MTDRNRAGYECAAKIDEQRLLANRKAVGTIDVGKLGCGSGGSFIVSMDEVRDARAGKLDYGDHPAAIHMSILTGILFGLLVNIGAIGLLGLVLLGRWVVGVK